MASAVKYVDNANGNNGNTGNSEVQAYADLATALAAITGGGNTIHIQAGTSYTYTVTETFPAALKGDATDGRNKLIGYTTTPGAGDGRPVITSATNSVALFTLNDNDLWEFQHLKFTHTASTRGNAFAAATSASSPLFIRDCIFDGCLTALNSTTLFLTVVLENCEIKNCTSTTAAIIYSGFFLGVYGCDIHDNAGDGCRHASGADMTVQAVRTIFDTNTNGINDVSNANNSTIACHACLFVDNTADGINTTSKASNTVTFELTNNIFYANAAEGIDNNDAQADTDGRTRINRNNAFGANTSNDYTGIAAGTGEIALSGDPFTNRGSRDFSLNNTAGAGAAVRAAAFPHAFVNGTTTSYGDVGAAQHQDSGGSSSGGQRVIGG